MKDEANQKPRTKNQKPWLFIRGWLLSGMLVLLLGAGSALRAQEPAQANPPAAEVKPQDVPPAEAPKKAKPAKAKKTLDPRHAKIPAKNLPKYMEMFGRGVTKTIKAEAGRIPRDFDALVPHLGGVDERYAQALLSGEFAMVDLLGRRVAQLDEPGKTILIYQAEAVEGQRWVVYVDGSTAQLAQEAFGKAMKAQGNELPDETKPAAK